MQNASYIYRTKENSTFFPSYSFNLIFASMSQIFLYAIYITSYINDSRVN